MIKLICFFTALFLLVSGILLLFFPSPAGLLYDIEDLELLASPLALGMGIRQFSMGLIILVLLIIKQYKTLGIVLLISTLIPIADFFIFSSITGTTSALRHLISIPFIISIGLYLLLKK